MKKLILTLLLTPILFFSCNKDKSIEKKITGNWAIDRITGRTFVTTQGSKNRIVDVTGNNAGSMSFNSENRGYINYFAGGAIINKTINKWENYEDTLAINFEENTFYFSKTAKFTFVEIANDILDLRYNEINKINADSTFQYSYYIRLKRKF